MVAARIEGYLSFMAVAPNKGQQVLMGYKDTRELAPTGKIAEPDKWYLVPYAPIALDGTNGWKIQLIMTSETAATMDNPNDTILKIPAIINGVATTIGKDEFQMTTGAKYAAPVLGVGVDTIIGEYKIPAGTTVLIGGAKGWFQPMDNA